MIAERRTYKVKQGQWRIMVALIKAEMKAVAPDIVSRICTPSIGPLGVVVHEMEFQNMEEREKFWEEWDSMFGQSGNVEIWNLQ